MSGLKRANARAIEVTGPSQQQGFAADHSLAHSLSFDCSLAFLPINGEYACS